MYRLKLNIISNFKQTDIIEGNSFKDSYLDRFIRDEKDVDLNKKLFRIKRFLNIAVKTIKFLSFQIEE